MSAIRCEILLFAALAEVIGASRVAVDLPARATVDDVWPALEAQSLAPAPTLAAWRNRVVVAVNERYVGRATPLRDGDRIALIPPVSGG